MNEDFVVKIQLQQSQLIMCKLAKGTPPPKKTDKCDTSIETCYIWDSVGNVYIWDSFRNVFIWDFSPCHLSIKMCAVSHMGQKWNWWYLHSLQVFVLSANHFLLVKIVTSLIVVCVICIIPNPTSCQVFTARVCICTEELVDTKVGFKKILKWIPCLQ